MTSFFPRRGTPPPSFITPENKAATPAPFSESLVPPKPTAHEADDLVSWRFSRGGPEGGWRTGSTRQLQTARSWRDEKSRPHFRLECEGCLGAGVMSSHDKRTSCVFVSSLPVCAHHAVDRAGGRRRIPHVHRRGHRSHRHELSQVPAPRRARRASPPRSVAGGACATRAVENPREGASTGVTRATTCFDVGGDARALARTSFLGPLRAFGPRARPRARRSLARSLTSLLPFPLSCVET